MPMYDIPHIEVEIATARSRRDLFWWAGYIRALADVGKINEPTWGRLREDISRMDDCLAPDSEHTWQSE